MVNTTVLILDDEAPFMQTLARRLSLRKLKVLSAPGGSAALDVLENEINIDAVILDVKMPGIDGIDTLRRIEAEISLCAFVSDSSFNANRSKGGFPQ